MSDGPTLEDVKALAAEVDRHRLKVACSPDVERMLREALARLGFGYPMPDIIVSDDVPEGSVYVFNPAALDDFTLRTERPQAVKVVLPERKPFTLGSTA